MEEEGGSGTVNKKLDNAGIVTPVETQKGNIQPSLVARQNLVDLAMKFLNNPRVMSYPLEEKKAFLRKKGEIIM